MKQERMSRLAGSKGYMRLMAAVLAATLACNASAAETPPFSPTPVDPYTAESVQGKSLKRLKISVATEDGADRQVRVGAVVACSKKRCLRAETSGFVDLDTTEEGKSSVVVDAAVPIGEIDSLYFEPTVGVKTLAGSISLNPPVTIEKDF
ncbi:MAG TPA: hypothetical protein VH328_11045, partial [Burkholderiaceae bacterium]|nr:hypothetical protein [Burkholderiaceae bacterium]